MYFSQNFYRSFYSTLNAIVCFPVQLFQLVSTQYCLCRSTVSSSFCNNCFAPFCAHQTLFFTLLFAEARQMKKNWRIKAAVKITMISMLIKYSTSKIGLQYTKCSGNIFNLTLSRNTWYLVHSSYHCWSSIPLILSGLGSRRAEKHSPITHGSARQRGFREMRMGRMICIGP